MDDKKQESKKTVVAFISGLIIGGVVVWLFAGSPKAEAPQPTDADRTPSALIDEDAVADETVGASDDGDATPDDILPPQQPVSGTFSFTVPNQPAGALVSLGDTVQYPTEQGWIVVHADIGGELGGALGAARYETTVGLRPTQVELLRNTEKDMTYRVVYYTESGDRTFDRKEDTPMTAEGGGLIEARFVAQ